MKIVILLITLLGCICHTNAFSPTTLKNIRSGTAIHGYNPWQLPKIPNNAITAGNNQGSTSKSKFSKDLSILDCLVVGSGISGSTAAYYMDKAGANIMLAEIRDEVGGKL